MIKFLPTLVILLFLFLLPKTDIFAADCTLTLSQTTVPPDFRETINLSSKDSCFQSTVQYIVLAVPQSKESNPQLYSNYFTQRLSPQPDNKTFSVNLNIFQKALGRDNPGAWTIKVCHASILSECSDPMKIVAQGAFQVSPVLTPTSTPAPAATNDQPVIKRESQSQCGYQTGQPVIVKVENVSNDLSYVWYWSDEKQPIPPGKLSPHSNITAEMERAATFTSSFNAIVSGAETSGITGKKTLCVDLAVSSVYQTFRTGSNCIDLQFYSKQPTDSEKSCKPPPVAAPTCTPGSPECPHSAGVKCNSKTGESLNHDDPNGDGILTAIGCVPTEPKALIQELLRVSSVAGGGIALLLMIAGSFQMITSAGDQHKLQAGREQFSNAIIGLLFIIFSVLLLRIIGVDILGLI